jgi:hypothetical protein
VAVEVDRVHCASNSASDDSFLRYPRNIAFQSQYSFFTYSSSSRQICKHSLASCRIASGSAVSTPLGERTEIYHLRLPSFQPTQASVPPLSLNQTSRRTCTIEAPLAKTLEHWFFSLFEDIWMNWWGLGTDTAFPLLASSGVELSHLTTPLKTTSRQL